MHKPYLHAKKWEIKRLSKIEKLSIEKSGMAASFRETAFLLIDMSNIFEYFGFKKIKINKNWMMEYEKKRMYVRVAKSKAKIYKFLSKQRFKLSAALLKSGRFNSLSFWETRVWKSMGFGAGQMSGIFIFGKGHCVFSFALIQPGERGLSSKLQPIWKDQLNYK